MSAPPVLVIGAGPVGLLTANLLAGEGIRSVVLERAAGPSLLPRAVHLDDEAQRVLQGLGLLDALRGRLHPATRYELRDGGGRLLHAFPRDRMPLGHPPSVLFHQPDLEAVLLDAARRSPLIDLRWGHEVVAVDPTFPAVQMVGPAAGRQRMEGAAVLACDGAASTVRRCLGVPSEDLGFDQPWLVVDLRTEQRPTALRQPQQRCTVHRPATSVPVGPRRHRLEFMLLPEETEESLAAELPALLASWGIDPAAVEVDRRAVYRFHALNADRWRQGAVFLLGDAAHQMPPFFGQGLCSGFRDAANLVWKLALVHRGLAADALLDTYETERRPQVAQTLRRTALLGRVVTGRGSSAGLLRRAAAGALGSLPALRRAVEGLRPPPLPAGPLVAARTRPLGPAGHPFPQPLLEDAEGVQRPADTYLGGGFALVGWRRHPLTGTDAATRHFWAALGARSLTVRPAPGPGPGRGRAGPHAPEPGCLTDPTGALARWFAGAGGAVAVVRPDRIVLGVARHQEQRALASLSARVAAFVA